jgi:hypothetical protein
LVSYIQGLGDDNFCTAIRVHYDRHIAARLGG